MGTDDQVECPPLQVTENHPRFSRWCRPREVRDADAGMLDELANPLQVLLGEISRSEREGPPGGRFPIAMSAEIRATIVLPLPTSPCRRRYIGRSEVTSAAISFKTFF